MNKLINIIGISSIVFAVAVGAMIAISAFAHWSHDRHCSGHETGHCGWSWCKYYDGSDRLHDFN